MPETDATPPLPGADPDLVARVPLGIRNVLLVGCGEGGLAAALRRRDPAARLLGTEADPALAAAARTRLDEVLELPPEAPTGLATGSIDCVVIERAGRLRDPGATLREAARLLAPQGVLVADTPNVEYWRVAAQLLAGGWRQDRDGPGGPDDIRFYSVPTMRDALEAVGLVPIEAIPRQAEPEAAAAFAERIGPALDALGSDRKSYLRRAAPRRFLWRASQGQPRRLAVVAHTLAPIGGVNDVRVHQPLAALATRPGVTLRIGRGPAPEGLPAEVPRLLILQRRLLDSPQAPAFIRELRRHGCVIIQEFDDDPAHWPSIARSNDFAFRGVHAVQTSTPKLEALFRRWNPEVAVFPNTVAELPEPVNFADPRRLTLFLGALRREDDTAPYLAGLNRLLAEAGDRLAVEVVWDQQTFDALATPHKRFSPLLPYAEYRALMARCELALLPLADTRFNNFKSDLKFVEAASHRLACIASPVVYGAAIRPGETGLIAATPEQAIAALRRLLAAPDEARAMGEAARAWVAANRMLAGHVAARRTWYDSLWARRQELDAALLRRTPEVGD